MRKVCEVILLAVVTAAAASCAPEGGARAPGRKAGQKVGVFVSIPPQAYFVQRVGGEHVEVDVLVAPRQDPHTFEPTPRQMIRLAAAEVYFRVGVPFEQALRAKLAAHEHLRIVDTRQGIDLRPSAAGPHRAGGDDRGHDDARPPHHGDEMDPHVWLSPKLAKLQAATICRTLCEVDPAHRDDYRRNLEDLHQDLDRLDARIAAALAPLKGRTFYVFHPAFGHFAAAYGLKQEAVETGGKSPGPKHLKELIDRARAEGVKVIFVQPQFSERAARTIARQIDGAVVPMDPLSRDYIRNLEEMAEKIRTALGGAAD